MSQERGQDRQRIEVGDAFVRLAIVQHESVHVGPIDDVTPDTLVKSELDEH